MSKVIAATLVMPTSISRVKQRAMSLTIVCNVQVSVSLVLAWHHDDPGICDCVAFTPIFFQIIADLRAIRDYRIFVDDRLADLDMPPDGDVFEEDGIFNQAVAIDLAARTENRPPECAAAGDAASTDVGVEALAAAVIIVKNRFGWWQVALIGENWPFVVVEIQLG